MGFVIKIETTYGDLRDGEQIVDKSGNTWLVVEPEHGDADVAFWLAETTTGVRMHHLTKPANDAVTALRAPTHAEEVAEREGEVDAADAGTGGPRHVGAPYADEPMTVEEVRDALGAETIAEESAAEADARTAAVAADDVLHLPAFEAMTVLEAQSHLFLIHGVYAHDVKTRKALDALHVEAHVDGPGQPRHEHAAVTA